MCKKLLRPEEPQAKKRWLSPTLATGGHLQATRATEQEEGNNQERSPRKKGTFPQVRKHSLSKAAFLFKKDKEGRSRNDLRDLRDLG